MSTTPQFNIKIDGKLCSATPGKTVLETAREHGIEIPTLCFDPRLPPYGSCLLCVVEVSGVQKLLLSCATEVKPDMVVVTKNERIFKARKDALDLLFSNHYADCRGLCYEKCPAGIDVQGYLALAKAGKYREALNLVQEKNPMPLVCGRVCVRYCEANCRRQHADDSVGVNFIKRYVSDLEYDNLPTPVVPPSNGRKVAIVGGGPGGLTTGYYLAKSGFKVTIFDMQEKLGGMTRWGIPEYRLPEKTIDKEIQYIIDHGIEVKTGQKLGRDFSLDDLKTQGFEAIYIATGAQKAKKMGIPNEDVEGVEGGIYFLERVKKAGMIPLKGHVLVVGGGNTAIDAVRTALRCKAERVTLLYRRTRDEMPADDLEIEDAIEEGVEFKYLVAPLEVISENGKVKALRVQQMRLGEPDESGRRRPVPVEGSEENIPCSFIIAAIGQDCDVSGLSGNKIGDVKISRKQTISVDEKTFATSVKSVFAGGDVVTGPAAVIDAIGAGRKAARVIEGYIMTGEMITPPSEFLSRKTLLGDIPPEFFSSIQKLERAHRWQIDASSRAKNFAEVDKTMKKAEVEKEASRCLACGCSSVFTCELKKYADEYDVNQTRFKGGYRKYEPDMRHPFIALDQNKCILCGKCVRLCGELIGVSALGFVSRGFETTVKPSLDKALQDTTCISCGNCIDVCPTGAIDFVYPSNAPGPWKTTNSSSVCNFCGVGCEVTFNLRDKDMWFVTARSPEEESYGEICVRGRFGHAFLNDKTRISEAKYLAGKALKGVDLESAISKAFLGLKKISDKHGPESVGFFVSPRATNEEAFLVQHLARKIFGTNNVGSFWSLERFGEKSPDILGPSLGFTASTLPREQVENADVIVIVNCDPTEENPVLSFGVRRALKKGATLVTINHEETPFDRISEFSFSSKNVKGNLILEMLAAQILKTGTHDPELIHQRVEGLQAHGEKLLAAAKLKKNADLDWEKITKVATLLADPGKNLVIIQDFDSSHDAGHSDISAAANLLLITGKIGRKSNGIILAREFSNSQGVLDLGIYPEAAPLYGYSHAKLSGATTQSDLHDALKSGKLRGFFVLGENPLAEKTMADCFKKAEFIVTMDLFESETTRKSDVVLPWSAYSETAGSITSMDRIVRSFNRAFAPPAGLGGVEIIAKLFGQDGEREPWTIARIRSAIVEAKPQYSPLKKIVGEGSFRWNEGKTGGDLLFENGFPLPGGRARFATGSDESKVKKVRPKKSSLDRFFESKIKTQIQLKK